MREARLVPSCNVISFTGRSLSGIGSGKGVAKSRGRIAKIEHVSGRSDVIAMRPMRIRIVASLL